MAKNIIFLCEGNICRSPTAGMVFTYLAKQAGVEDRFIISSKGTTSSTAGEDLYSYSKEILLAHHIPILPHKAERITVAQYQAADLVIVMENYNAVLLKRAIFARNFDKVHRLLEYTDRENKEIDDPYYTRDFETAFQDIYEGCEGLLKALCEE